jgi:uncharacterized damage-inducible protein DinB
MPKKKTTSRRSAAKKPKAKATRPAPKSAGGSEKSPKQQFLHRYAMEHDTTMRVLRAIPPTQGEFRPHMRSNSVNGLIYTMLFEQELARRAVAGGPIMGAGAPPEKPANLAAGIEAFEQGYRAMAEMIRKTPDAKLQRLVQFPVAKGQMGDWSALDFIWYMLLDQIHHRGQMSVYLRLAGGKVPSIYGPSADDTWT